VEADKAAKEGTALPTPAVTICTLAPLKRSARTNARLAATQLWSATAPANYNELLVKYSTNTDELCLSRAELGRILVARSQHGDFAAYHERFNHDNAALNCLCGRPKSPLHFYFCKKSTARKLTRGKPTSEAIPWLLGTTKGALKLADWITASEYFTDICRSHSREDRGL
jgi:hypothetical protein